MVDWRAVEVAGELAQQFEVPIQVFEGRPGILEIPVVGIAIGAHRAALRQGQRGAVVFREVAAGGIRDQVHREFHAAGDHRDFTHPELQPAALGA